MLLRDDFSDQRILPFTNEFEDIKQHLRSKYFLNEFGNNRVNEVWVILSPSHNLLQHVLYLFIFKSLLTETTLNSVQMIC